MMRRLMFGVALVCAIAGAVLFYQSASRSTRSGSDVAVYSARRYDPYGTAALRDLLVERGVPVRTLESPSLRASDRGVLIQVLTTGSGRNWRYDVPTPRLVEWMQQGNTVIQLTRSVTPLMTHLKVAPTTVPSNADSTQRIAEDFEESGAAPDAVPVRAMLADVELPDAAASKASPLLLWSPMILAEDQRKLWTPIARLRTGRREVVGGQLAVGGGKLVVVGAPTPALNGTLGSHGNLQFILDQIGDRPVIFDEWSHGIGRQATIIGFIRDVGLVPLLVQVLFVAIIYVWSTTGYPRREETHRARRRSSIEQIQTLGFLYSRSFNPDVTYNYVNAEVLRRLGLALRCRPKEIPSVITALKPALRARCEELLRQLSELRPQHGPRCMNCGYDLYLLTSDRCPECGTVISPEMHQRVFEASRNGPPGANNNRRRFRHDRVFANVLTSSHNLFREIQRDRSAL